MDTLGNRFHVNFLGYAHWFMSIKIPQLKYHYISVYQYRYATSLVENDIDTPIIRENSKFHKNTFPRDIIFTKEDYYNSYEKVEVMSIEYNIQYRACMISFIYPMSARVDLCFALHNLE